MTDATIPFGRFFEAPAWRFVVSNLADETLTWLDHLALDRSVTITRAAARVCEVRVPSDNPEVNIPTPLPDGDPFVAEGTRILTGFRREGRTGSAPGKVMKSVASASDAWAKASFVVGESEVWVTYDQLVLAAGLAFFQANHSGAIVTLDQGGSGAKLLIEDDSGPIWVLQPGPPFGESFAAPPVADAYQTIKFHYLTDGTTELYVDGVLADTHTSNSPGDVIDLYLGQRAVGTTDPDAIVYIRNPKAGTTDGGSDLFADDFSSGDFSAWADTFGDVSVVDDPLAAGGGAVTGPWRVRFRGLILNLTDDADTDHATSTATAYDPWKYLYRRPVLLSDGRLPGDQGRIYPAGTRPDEIILDQLDLARTYGTPIYVDFDSLEWEGTIEECDPLPDGGDGIGLTLEKGVSLGEMLDRLVATGTCDIVLDPVYDIFLRPGILCDLSIYRKAGAFKPDALFGWDRFPRNVVQVQRAVDGTERANRIQFYAGQGGPPVPIEIDAASVARYGDYFAQQFFPGVPSLGAAHLLAQRQLALLASGQLTYALTPAAERGPNVFTEYREADVVPLSASKRLRAAIPGDRLRVEAIPIVIGDDQLERVNQLLVTLETEPGS